MQDSESEYVYISRLGEGSYGSVLLCLEVLSDEEGADGQGQGRSAPSLVAVKRFKWSHNDNVGLRLALREIRLLKSLNHPLIIPLRRAFFSPSCRLHAVFPYIDGGCAQSALGSKYPRGMPPPVLKSFAWQLCLAVRYLHSRKVLHRDIKPTNILMSSDGSIRLCDFGFARRLVPSQLVPSQPAQPGDAPPPPSPPPSGGICAASDDDNALTPYVQTRPYRAPEVLLGLPYGTAADIWSVGATMYEMATGEVLLPGSSSLDQLWRVLGALPGPWPEQLSRAVRTLRQLDPAALGDGVTEGMLRPKQLPGPTLHERLAAAAAAASAATAAGGAGLEPGLLDFIESCLRLDPAARPTADQLLQMPWLSEGLDGVLDGKPLLEQLRAALAAEAPTASAVTPMFSSCIEERALGADWEPVVAAAQEAGFDRRAVTVTNGGGSGGRKGYSSGASVVGSLQPSPPPRDQQFGGGAATAATATKLPSVRAPAGTAPAHRRSLSANKRAEAQAKAAPPVGAAAAAAADQFPQSLKKWKLQLSAGATAATVMPPMPAQPPPLAHFRQTDAMLTSSPAPPVGTAFGGLLPLAATVMAASTAVAPIPVSLPPPPLPQLLEGYDELPVRLAESLDAAINRAWAEAQGATGLSYGANAAAASAAQPLGLTRSTAAQLLLVRPKFKPGRVRQLPPPPATAPERAVAAGPVGLSRRNRNASAPDLLLAETHEAALGSDGLAQEAISSTAPAAAAVTLRGMWSQSGCLDIAQWAKPFCPGAMLAAAADAEEADAGLFVSAHPGRTFPVYPPLADGGALPADGCPDGTVAAANSRFRFIQRSRTDGFTDRWRPTCLGYICSAGNASWTPNATAAAAFANAPTAPQLRPGDAPPAAAAGVTTLTVTRLQGRSAFCVSGEAETRVGCASPGATAPMSLFCVGAIGSPRAARATDIASRLKYLADDGDGLWPAGPLAVGGGAAGAIDATSAYGMVSGDGRQVYGLSYGTRKSILDSEEGWLEELASWREYGKMAAGVAAAAAADRVELALQPVQLTSPTITTTDYVGGGGGRCLVRSGGCRSGLGVVLNRFVKRLLCFGGGGQGSHEGCGE